MLALRVVAVVAMMGVIVVFGGCAQAEAIRLNPGIEYPPTEYAELLLEEPNVAYDIIAIIESTASQYVTRAQAIKAMQNKAAQEGAHAIIVTDEISNYVPAQTVPNPVQGGQPIYFAGGTVTELKGLAIRYKQ